MLLRSDSIAYSLNFSVLKDATTALSLAEVKSQITHFQSFDRFSEKLDKTAAYWLNLNVENQLEYRKKWVITTQEVDIAILYLINKEGEITRLKSGKLVPYSERNYQKGKPHSCQFHIDLSPYEPVQVWLRLYNPTKAEMQLEANIYTLEKWQVLQYDQFFTRQLIIGIFLGFLGIMLLYTFSNYLLLKEKIYLYYGIYILGPFLYPLNYEGFLFPSIIGETPMLYLYIRVLTPPIAIVGYLAFTRSFLNTAVLIPKWDRVFKGLIIIELLLIVYALIIISFHLDVFLFRSIPVVFHMLVLFATFLLSFTLLKDNKSLTRYFVLGVAAYTLSTISLNYIAISKIIPLNIGLLIQAAGFVIELVAFSIGLGYRQKMNAEEKQQIEAENARILREQNQYLEKEVTERTQEINIQKEEIEMQAEELRLTNERLLELSEFKQAMTSMIVHDLKNPLASTLQLTKEPITKQNSLRMLNMVMNILDIDKMEDTHIPIKWHRHALTKVIQDAYHQVILLIDQKSIGFTLDLPKSLLIYADYDLSARILVNLLTNAIKFTPVNGQIQIKAKELSATRVKVEVINTGAQIPKEKLAALFDKYAQVESRKSGGIRATGLGLTFCKLALEAHDCEIGAVSENNKTCFWFTLPVKPEITGQEVEKETVTLLSTSNVKQIISEEDRKILQVYFTKLNTLEVFDYSEIQAVLQQIENTSAGIQQWKEAVAQAIAVCNQEKYQELIQNEMS